MDLVLIHGMGRTPLSMMRLRGRLRRRGHNPILFGYSPTLETLQGATARLVRLIDRRIGNRPYALIGHSLGTVIIRTALGQLENRAPSACFFLAPPILACKAARYFSRFRLYRLLTGEMGQLLARDAFMRQLPMPPMPSRIYAGVRGPRAAWLPFGRDANDGILSVAEATGDFKSMVVEVPSIHTFIMNSKQVFDDLAKSLENIEQPTHTAPELEAQHMHMIRLSKSLNAWGTPAFKDVITQEIAQLPASELPLQQGLAVSSYVTDSPFQAMLISAAEDGSVLRVKAGIFYTGVIAGCSCADDPTPIDEQTEYCVVQFAIDTATAETTVALLAE